MRNILILDTGKEWGGGTNSLLELLRRIDKKKYNFTALFYYNYCKPDEIYASFNPPLPPLSKGGGGGFSGKSDIKTEIEKLGIDFILFKSTKQPIYAKILKEIGRAVLFFNRRLRKLYIFWIDYLFRIRKNADGLAKLLKDLNTDLLYMNNQPSSNLEGIIAAKKTGVKSLLHSRIETDLNFFEINAVNKWLTNMICVSEGVKENFVRQGIEPSKCAVVYNGIDIGMVPAIPRDEIRQKFGIKEDEVAIGSVGSLMKRKRFNDLVKAVAYIRAQSAEHRTQKFKNPPIPPFDKGDMNETYKLKCIIIGDGPERESLQRKIDRTGLNDRIILTGFKSDAISYMSAMDIFILPSEREGFPRVILEAMLMGKPVIASKAAGSVELVIDKETGFLFHIGNTKELAERISTLLSSPELRREMGERGTKRVTENFSIEKYVAEVSQIFTGVAG